MTEHNSEKIAHIHEDLHSHLPSEPALRVKALESLLIEKKMVDPAAIDAWVEAYSEEIGPKRGAQLIARAWTDPAFRELLLTDAPKAVAEFGFEGWATGHTVVLENTATTHNLVVCTLCSCYPITLLGVPPNWYKTAAYRSRAVREPRSVLAEFGVTLSPDIEVRVWDSTSEMRYMVMPERPAGTESWSADQLAAIVTRNAMIGTQRDLPLAVKEPA
ncbi:MAG: nitrile hydratase subunit alpha [Stappiaceae bacterium]